MVVTTKTKIRTRGKDNQMITTRTTTARIGDPPGYSPQPPQPPAPAGDGDDGDDGDGQDGGDDEPGTLQPTGATPQVRPC
jgi:hypothetical protein